jgi:hypothetical protein
MKTRHRMKTRRIEIVSRVDGDRKPADMVICGECGHDAFILYRVECNPHGRHMHLQCAGCSEVYCEARARPTRGSPRDDHRGQGRNHNNEDIYMSQILGNSRRATRFEILQSCNTAGGTTLFGLVARFAKCDRFALGVDVAALHKQGEIRIDLGGRAYTTSAGKSRLKLEIAGKQ